MSQTTVLLLKLIISASDSCYCSVMQNTLVSMNNYYAVCCVN